MRTIHSEWGPVAINFWGMMRPVKKETDMKNSDQENWEGQRLIGGSPAPEPVSSPTPPEHSELTAEQAFARGYISALPDGHYMKESATGGIGGSELLSLRRELETCKRLYNDLAREYEELKEANIANRIDHLLENPIVYQLSEADLKRYCDNARAYGWEAGRLSVLNPLLELKPKYDSHNDNPFVKPDWDRNLPANPGFQVTAKDNPL